MSPVNKVIALKSINCENCMLYTKMRKKEYAWEMHEHIFKTFYIHIEKFTIQYWQEFYIDMICIP